MPSDMTSESMIHTEDPQTMGDPRIVLFGRDEAKSKLINAIQSTNMFTPETLPEGDTPKVKKCQKYRGSIDGKNEVIIDTPGLYISGDDKNEVLEGIKWSVAVANPGPHVFLFVETIYRPLGEKLEALKDFQKTFGEQANDFTMVVFTTERNKDEEETIQHFRELTYPFNHRYFIFNTEGNEQQEVTELLEKVAKMKEEASARFYTPKMLWEAEKQQEDKEQKQKEERQKQKEERHRKKWGRIFVIGAQVGATIGFLISAFFDLNSSAAAGGVGSVCGVIFVTLIYCINSKFKQKK